MDRYAESFRFQYKELLPCVVQGVAPLDKDRRLFATVAALDGRGTWHAPVAASYGVSRNVRPGMTVLLLFRNAASNYPVIVATLPNLESDPRYANPLPPPHEYIDDQVYHHPETGAFIRMRNTASSATYSGPDGSAGITEVTMASGLSLKLSEYPQSGTPPPKPNRATASITMPSGAEFVIDEPSVGTATLALTLPSGFRMTVGADGNVLIATPTEVAINAPRVTVGGVDGAGKSLAFLDDVQRLVGEFNAHQHPNGEDGRPTGSPQSPASPPIGTKHAEGV